MRNQNYWISDKNAFAYWVSDFPIVKDKSDVQRIINFIRRCVEVGEQEQILMIRKSSQSPRFDSSSGESYPDFVERMVSESGQLPLFNIGYPNADTIIAKVCYYTKNGEITLEEVSDMAFLLKQLRSPSAADVEFGLNAYPRPPVHISGYETLSVSPPPQREYGPAITIRVHTDIWFPKVVGYLEENSALTTGEMFDNRELAQCHTPRFNRFLLGVHQATLELGGIWNFYPEECRGQYRYMLTPTGILLNI